MRKILITGGVRSGKSRYALTLADQIPGKKIFFAAAEAIDEEMKVRIAKHKEERGDTFLTVEEPLYLAKRIEQFNDPSNVIVVDCLTFWVNNLLHHWHDDSIKIRKEKNEFLDAFEKSSAGIIAVTNETGAGILPDNALAREFQQQLGFLNQHAAQRSSEVIWMVAGIPQWIKGKPVEARENI